MSKNRYAARVDGNQKQIKDDLEAAGFSVEVGHDDILVGAFGMTFWYEIKSERAVSKKTGKVREKEIKNSQGKILSGYKGHYKIVSSSDEIIKDINQTMRRLKHG